MSDRIDTLRSEVEDPWDEDDDDNDGDVPSVVRR